MSFDLTTVAELVVAGLYAAFVDVWLAVSDRRDAKRGLR